ncbi:MAG: hypothetical protein RLZZ479_1261 [Bacteroidota bacterium]|jgi:hypothetical protein
MKVDHLLKNIRYENGKVLYEGNKENAVDEVRKFDSYIQSKEDEILKLKFKSNMIKLSIKEKP